MRLRRQGGFTLIELMIAISVGMIVTLAAFSLLDRSVIQTGKTTDRVDSTQRGRIAMDQITRHLRSQVCPIPAVPSTKPPPIDYGDGNTITFWAFFGTRNFNPERHTIAWNPNTESITESVDSGPNTPVTRTSTLLSSARLPNNVPLFTYYAYPTGVGAVAQPTDQIPVPPATAATPLSATERARVARIDVNFAAVPTHTPAGVTPAGSTTTPFTDQVYVRMADPNAAGGSQGPQC
jgi:prepilin-type N-terminal cleavage/methylation domain-containing protein